MFDIIHLIMDDRNRHLTEKEILDITKAAMHKTFGDYGGTFSVQLLTNK